MTFTIPEWLLWTLGLGVGIPLLIVIGFCAWIGALFIYSFK